MGPISQGYAGPAGGASGRIPAAEVRRPAAAARRRLQPTVTPPGGSGTPLPSTSAARASARQGNHGGCRAPPPPAACSWGNAGGLQKMNFSIPIFRQNFHRKILTRFIWHPAQKKAELYRKNMFQPGEELNTWQFYSEKQEAWI